MTAAPAKSPSPSPFLSSVAAQLFVSDIRASCNFFLRLGFTTDFVYGEPPFYGQVRRDNVRLALRRMEEAVYAGDIRDREGLLSAAITVDTAQEIECLFAAFEFAKASFHQGLRTEPWGARNFILRDPDGNLLLFAGPSEPDAQP